METYKYGNREEYFNTQIAASKKKFRYCKVSIPCVERFKEIILRANQDEFEGPILCLATRNGREVDLFRNVFFGNPIKNIITGMAERRQFAFSSRLHFYETNGRSNIKAIGKNSVVGVELNPDGEREDVLVGSFDALPREWSNTFSVVYSNSLDHAFDPHKAVAEWNRVVKPGGFFVIGFPNTNMASEVDPVGNITLDDVRKLFPGKLIYSNAYGNAFCDAIIRKDG